MNTIKWLLTATFITGTGIAVAQQEPPGRAPAEKIAPQTNGGSSPGVITNGALHDGAGAADRKNNKELSEGNRTGELQENRGRTDTTGQAPTREQNRVPNDKKSDGERVAPAVPPK
jgi:hypothetical protein